MNPNQLDLSKFPKITQISAEEISLETAKRSQGLEVIRDLMEQTLNAMQSYLADLSNLDSQQKVIDRERSELSEIDKQLRFQHQQQSLKQQLIDEQLSYIDRQNKEWSEKKLALEALKDEQMKQNNDALGELDKKQHEITLKEAQLKVTEDKLNELKDMEVAVKTSQSIDAGRKALLDKREQKILEREARLARLEGDAKIG